MITDSQIDQLFDDFLASPELASWSSDLSAREHEKAKVLYRAAVRKALQISDTNQARQDYYSSFGL